MAASATDVVTLADLKRELRLDPADASQDDVLTLHIEDAVSYVAAYVAAPLVDREAVEWMERPAPAEPLLLHRQHVKAVGVRYWSAAGALRSEPDGQIAPADLGRITPVGRVYTEVWPPAAGWPAVHDGSRLRVAATIGLDLDAASKGIRQAVICYARGRYDGAYAEAQDAIFALLAPWRTVGR